MQQPSTLSYYYAGGTFNQDGGGAAAPQWLLEGSKPNQFNQWDNNGGFHVTTGNNYVPGQVQGGGGQNRVQVNSLGPQQPQQPSQPTPTSTPPGIHGDMSKQQSLMQNQTAQMNFVQSRTLNPNFGFQRGTMQQTPQIRTQGRTHIVAANNWPLPGVLTQAPAQTIVQAVQYSPTTALMYGPRQGAPYPNQGQYMLQQSYYNAHTTPPQYYQQVIPQSYQGMSSGGPSPQVGGQQPPVPMMRPNLVPTASVVTSVKQEPKKRPNAIKIIDPTTNEEVAVDTDSGGNNNNITPTRSNDSSARETPQPTAGVNVVDPTVAADFAARVAARAMAPESRPPSLPPPDPVQDSINVAISDSEIHHKQQPLVVPSSEKIFNTTLSTSSEEFIPRSHKQAQSCEPTLEEPRTSVVPTVSAETNSPAIDIRPKEQFPALKNPTVPSAPQNQQSPLRINSKKQKGSENERQQAAIISTSVQMNPPPPPSIDNKDIISNNRKGSKGSQKEDNNVSKERREKTRPKDISCAPSPEIPSLSSQPDSAQSPVVKVPPASAGLFVKDQVKGNSVALPTLTPVEEPVVSPATKVLQQQNGETALPEPPPATTNDGTKTTRHKEKKLKKRDYRKEKEGSEMDAFVTEPSIVAEEKERSATPITPPPSVLKIPPISPPPAVDTSAPLSPVDKIKEDLKEKEDKLVAAKNEENNKISALSEPEDEQLTSIIEKPAPLLTLKRSYEKDQWSPLNPGGKKKYGRAFLIELKGEPQSNLKPENLPDVVAVLNKDSPNIMRIQNMPFIGSRDVSGMMPSFGKGGSQSQRGLAAPKRNSQQGSKGKNNPKLIHLSLSLHEDVKLNSVENAWKPTRLVSDADKSEEQKQTEEVYKNVRGILNKLTPQKFDTLMKKFLDIPINSEERLKGVIDLIFEKAVDEPTFSKAYANMCKICSKTEVTKIENGKEEKVNFRKILITKCQTEFESNKPAELDAAKRLEEISNCSDPEKKKELQLAFEEKERQIRMKSVGNIRFIGELFKLNMLTPAIMYRCIEHLLNTPEEESLECLCKLLTTIGKDLESGQANSKTQHFSLNPYFQRMSELAQKKEGSKVSSRVRFMLQDVIELRQNKWVPRREDNNPKTIEQINKEAERESIEMTMALNQQPPRMNRPNDRQDDRKRGNRGASNNQNEDGWVNVTSGSRHYHNKFTTPFEAAKMQSIKPEMDLTSLSLGGSQMYRFPTASSKNVEAKSTAPFTSNLYSALQPRVDERKPPPPQPSMNRRMTPTPSIERDKERQRMIQGAMESEIGRSSRGNSAHQDRPQHSSQPPSRDSSIPRQPPVDKDNKEASENKAKWEEEKNIRIVDKESARLAAEKLERQTNTIFDEYLEGVSTLEDVKQDIEQFYPADKIEDFVRKALEISLEKKAGAQKRIGVLLSALMDYNVFTPDVIVSQLSSIYENADDIAIDVPKVWELQAHVVVPIIAGDKITFSHIKAACSSVLGTKASTKLLVPILNNLVKEKEPGFVRKIWDSSNVSLKDFLCADVNVDAFIKENSLEYLTGEPPKYDSSSNLSIDKVQEKMLRLIQSGQPYEKILEFISSNVGDKVEDLQFIRALITSICEACITGSNYNLDSARFKQYEKLIQRYVDNKEDRELACLSSVHILLSKLEHPQGLIKNIFNLFLEDGLISCESFLKWKEDDQEKLENKGVSILSLSSFFSALKEVESDDENS